MGYAQDNLKEGSDSAKALFNAFGGFATGHSPDDVISAALNLVLNAIRQGTPQRSAAIAKFGDLYGRSMEALMEHYDPVTNRPPVHVPLGHQVDRVLARVRLAPGLHHPEAGRRVAAQHGRRHDVPAERLGHDVRRHLPAGQRAVGEVPQRPLPRDRLVDALDARRRRAWRCRRRSRWRPA